MTDPSRRVDNWTAWAPLVASVALLVWLLLREFVPAHPIDQPIWAVILAAALMSATGARLVSSVWSRRLAAATTVALVIAVFWFL